jgi:hypothetical protein
MFGQLNDAITEEEVFKWLGAFQWHPNTLKLVILLPVPSQGEEDWLLKT